MATATPELECKRMMIQTACQRHARDLRRFPFLQLELRHLIERLPNLSLSELDRRLDRFEDLAQAALGAAGH